MNDPSTEAAQPRRRQLAVGFCMEDRFTSTKSVKALPCGH